jgi:endonuclease/exonuclease/phosphatase family metal-dependent hydrolase
MGRSQPVKKDARDVPPAALRILTYNVHSCRGRDGKVSPGRIARVIAACRADVVALQEIDVGWRRTGYRNQAEEIARLLGMHSCFHPSFENDGQQYGNALLSRYPLEIIKTGTLPASVSRPEREPRSAVWIAVTAGEQRINILNTHLGLKRRERLLQIEALLGDEWLAHPSFRTPRIVCGDFNALPRSLLHRRLMRFLRDSQTALAGHKPQRTWPSWRPVARLDYVFVDPATEIAGVEVPRTQLARTASDHLPLVVEIKL